MATGTCPGYWERDQRIAALERRVAELDARLGTNATNSSIPPSANPPGAPKPVTKKRTGKKPGGQPGQPAHLRRRLPPERVDQVVPVVPDRCGRCQEPLPPQPGPEDPEPTRHQGAEWPEMAAHVTEYQGHYRTCPCGGEVSHAAIPHDLKAHSVGPRRAATLGYLAGSHHVSKRGLEEIAEDVFDGPLSLGSVAHVEAPLRAALAPAHAEALAVVRAAGVKNVDETRWKLAGQLCGLWVAATGTVAAFLIQAHRGWDALAALLGETITGWVCSDRWSAYAKLSPWCRPIGWAHLPRDFQKLVDRGGSAARLGKKWQRIGERVFEEWQLFGGGGGDRASLMARLDGAGREWERLLKAGRRSADTKTATFCANVLALLPAVWRFVVTEGVEPTNNHAERLLRRGVRWRQKAFGCHRAAGCRFVERILTVVQRRRLQGRSVLRFLYNALVAHRNGLPAPSLLSAE